MNRPIVLLAIALTASVAIAEDATPPAPKLGDRADKLIQVDVTGAASESARAAAAPTSDPSGRRPHNTNPVSSIAAPTATIPSATHSPCASE